MGTAVAINQASEERSQNQALQPVVNPVLNTLETKEAPLKDYYLEDSEFYQIRGGFVAEVIQNPMFKFIQKGITGNVIKDLTRVTLASFGKSKEQKEEYASEKVIIKNAIFVDWLTIVRHESEVIAYAASSYLDEQKSKLYLSATIVEERYQSKSGLGLVSQLYTWQKILKTRGDFESKSLDIVTRSRNKDVARIMDCVLKNMKISGAEELLVEEKSFFSMIAKAIESPYDEKSGINPSVYPAGLPGGADKEDEINRIFLKLNECDAYLIYGKANYERIEKLLRREVKVIEQNEAYATPREKIAA